MFLVYVKKYGNRWVRKLRVVNFDIPLSGLFFIIFIFLFLFVVIIIIIIIVIIIIIIIIVIIIILLLRNLLKPNLL